MNIQKFVKKNAPTILTFLGVAGVVGTAVLVAKETPKANDTLTKCKEEKTPVPETIISVAKDYVPAIAMGSVTIFSITASNCLNKKQQASIISAYGMLDQYFKDYRRTLIELHGQEADDEVIANMARYSTSFHQLDLDYPDKKVIFIEPYSGARREMYEREAMDAEYHINRNFMLRGYMTLAEYCDLFGFDLDSKTYREFEEKGWTMADDYYWLDFEHGRDRRFPGGICIWPMFEPTTDHMDEYI